MGIHSRRRSALAGVSGLVVAICSLTACSQGSASGGNSNGSGGSGGCDVNYTIGSKSDKSTNYRDLSSKKIDVDSDTRIGVVLKTLANQYWSEVKRGTKAAAKQHNVDVTVQAAESESSQSQQLTIAQTMAGQNFDAFVIAPETDNNLNPAIRQIKGDCKPIVDVIEPGIEATTYVGTDEKKVGKAAADYLADQLPKGAGVLHIEGQAGSKAGEDRTAGFKKEAAKRGLKVLADGVGDWSQTKAYNATQTLLQRFPKAAGIYAANDTMALGVAKAVQQAKSDALIVGTDAIPAAIHLIRKGKMAATLTPFPYYQGCKAFEVSLLSLSGQEAPSWLDTPPTLITRDNVSKYFDSKGVVIDTGSCQPPKE